MIANNIEELFIEVFKNNLKKDARNRFCCDIIK